MFQRLKEIGKGVVQAAVTTPFMIPVVVSIVVIGASFLVITGGGNLGCDDKEP